MEGGEEELVLRLRFRERQPDEEVDDKDNIRKLISQLSNIQAERVQQEVRKS